MEKTILEQLQKAMEINHIKIPSLAKKLGIPKDRIYKWYQEGTMPKAEDSLKLWEYIRGEKTINELHEEQSFYGMLEEIKANPGKKAEDFVFSYEELVQMNRNNIAIIKELREKLAGANTDSKLKKASGQ